jgi:hypothetical protein
MLIAGDKTKTMHFPSNEFEYTRASHKPFYEISAIFLDFILPLHKEFTSRQQSPAAKELDSMLREFPPEIAADEPGKFRRARRACEDMIARNQFNPS